MTSNGIGYGLPWWLPAEYLSADETRALGEPLVGRNDGRCCICTVNPATDGAHVIRKGMGGRQDNLPQGPIVGLCRPCHTGPEGVDRKGNQTMAVRDDGRIDLLVEHDGVVSARPLGWVARP